MIVRALACFTLFVVGLTLPQELRANQSGFSVTDSIEMSRFNTPGGRGSSDGAEYSPDGRFVVVVTSRGVIASNRIESKISLFESNDLRQFVKSELIVAPKPRVLATLDGVPSVQSFGVYKGVISNVRWSADSQTLYFLASDGREKQGLFAVGVDGAKFRRLSLHNQDVQNFDLSTKTIAYTVVDSADITTMNEGSRNSAHVLTGTQLDSILFPNLQAVPHLHELWVIRRSQPPRHVGGASSLALDSSQQVLSISPDGKYVAELLPITTNVPAAWSYYEPSLLERDWRIRVEDVQATSPTNVIALKEYAVVALDSGKVARLKAPFAGSLGYSDASIARWSADSSTLLVTNTFLPIDGEQRNTGDTLRQEYYPCTAATMTITASDAHCISWNRFQFRPMFRLEDGLFESAPSIIELSFLNSKGATQRERYRFALGKWVLQGPAQQDEQNRSPLSVKTRPLVAVKESLNKTPALWVTDKAARRSKELWDPNPRFNQIEFGEASVYHWRDKSGFEWTGGLVKPVSYVPGRRYPLVIQTHGFVESEFITDGQFPTAMAARPLSSAGIMVLQVGVHNEHLRQYQEAVDQVFGYEAAIGKLNAEALVDPRRVGIVGFSRTCWYVENALVNSPMLFRAAILADGVDEGYMQYLLSAPDYPLFANEFEAINGGQPFGETLSRWTAQSAGFHTDKIVAPVRIEAIGPSSILQEWEIYSSLRLQRKPVDLLYIPAGQHILQSPRDRLASQQGTVDWFRFWLQDYEDPNPTKVTQYQRWEQLRAMSEEQHY